VSYTVHKSYKDIPVWVRALGRPLLANVELEKRTDTIDLTDFTTRGERRVSIPGRTSLTVDLQIHPFARDLDDAFLVGERLSSGVTNFLAVVDPVEVTYFRGSVRSTRVDLAGEIFRYSMGILSLGPFAEVGHAGWRLPENPFDRGVLSAMLDDALDRGVNEAPFRRALDLLEKHP
jgi:hypothetical protein